MRKPLASLRAASFLPLLLLLLTLATVFLFSNDRGQFYRPGHHSVATDHWLAVARNLSPEHGFLGIRRHVLDADGNPAYLPYNRFPLGGFLLIKLAIMPFDHSLPAALQAARALMLLCFVGMAALAYLSLCRLCGQRWIALTATLLSFSSYYWLHYNDMVSTEVSLDFLAVLLCFHGMLVFTQEGRFKQLLAKTCIALLIGWHVYALLLPFILLHLFKEGRAVWLRRPSAPARAVAATLLRSRPLRLGMVALLFGVAVLGFNLANEYRALDGETALAELPSVQSILKRTGIGGESSIWGAGDLAWPTYLPAQFYRIGRMALPYALPAWIDALQGSPGWPRGLQGLILGLAGLALFCACLIGLKSARHRILFATLILSGFCWALLMRYQAWHNYEAVAYTGIPLAFFSLLLLGLQRRFGKRLIAGLAVAAMLVFALSSQQMAQIGLKHRAAERQRAIQSDFQAIRELTKGKTTFIDQQEIIASGLGFVMDYYFSGRIALASGEADRRDLADFVILRERAPAASLHTPGNQLLFLHDRATYNAWRHARIDAIVAEAGAPILRTEFDIYLHGGQLIYLKRACRREDALQRFFLHLFPANEDDLPAGRRAFGFDNLDFYSRTQGVGGDGRCGAIAQLPSYPIARIRTGQFIRGAGQLWKAEFALGEPPAAAVDRPRTGG